MPVGPDFVTPAQVLQAISDYFGDLTADRAQYRDWAGGTLTGGPGGDGIYPLQDHEGTTHLVPCPAKIAGTVEETMDSLSSFHFGSWAALAATTASNGIIAVVSGDAGTHEDPVSLLTVPNSGIFAYSTTPAGWKFVARLPFAVSTDETMADASDDVVPSQLAVATYIDNAMADTMVMKGAFDLSGNPMFPVGKKGDTYVVTVAGRIGGVMGQYVEPPTLLICENDNLGGNLTTAGPDWFIVTGGSGGGGLDAEAIIDLMGATIEAGDNVVVEFNDVTDKINISAVPTPASTMIPAGTLRLIERRVLTSASASELFSSLGDYEDLEVEIIGRGDAAAVSVTVQALLNEDNGANYPRQRLISSDGGNTTGYSLDSVGFFGMISGGNAPAGSFGYAKTILPGYRRTEFNKAWYTLNSFRASTATSGQNLQTVAGSWLNTAAISTLRLQLSSGNFAAGTIIAIHGRVRVDTPAPNPNPIISAQLHCTDPDGSPLTVANGVGYFRVPPNIAGMDLIGVSATLTSPSISGNVSVQLNRRDSNQNMLSTEVTVDAGEGDSITAAVPAVINPLYHSVATGTLIRVDVTAAGTEARGLIVQLNFRAP